MPRLTRVSSRRQLMHRLRYLDKRESHYVHMYISVARDRGNLTGDTFCAQPSRVTGRINHPLYFPPDAPRKLKPLRVPGSGGVIHLENPSSSARQFPPYLLPVIFNIALLLPCTGASRYEISHVETNLSYISHSLSLSLCGIIYSPESSLFLALFPDRPRRGSGNRGVPANRGLRNERQRP